MYRNGTRRPQRKNQEGSAALNYLFSGSIFQGIPGRTFGAGHPTVEKAGLRKRVMYQARHTFASMMLANGEDPLWVSQILGHTTLDMLYKHYGKFIRNRMRKDGGRFLQGLQEAGWETETPAIPSECFTAESRQSKEKGLRELPVTL